MTVYVLDPRGAKIRWPTSRSLLARWNAFFAQLNPEIEPRHMLAGGEHNTTRQSLTGKSGFSQFPPLLLSKTGKDTWIIQIKPKMGRSVFSGNTETCPFLDLKLNEWERYMYKNCGCIGLFSCILTSIRGNNFCSFHWLKPYLRRIKYMSLL